MPQEELTKRVRAARSYAGITQEDMANRLDMSAVTYKRIEQGKRDISISELDRIAEITGWPVELFHGELAAAAGEGDSAELGELRDNIKELVARLEDIEWRMRRNVTESAAASRP